MKQMIKHPGAMNVKRNLSPSNRIRSNSYRDQVAYHEAGHAVISYRLQPEVEILDVVISNDPLFEAAVSIYPVDSNGKCAGVTVINRKSPFGDMDAIVNLAGFAAEKLFVATSARRTGAYADYKEVRCFIRTLDPEMQVGHRKKLKRLTDELVFEYREDIECIAELLIKRGYMNGYDIKWFLDNPLSKMMN